MIRLVLSLTLALLALTALITDGLAGSDDHAVDGSFMIAADETVGNCVRTSRIRRTRILDDSTILLQMAGGDDLLMHLKYRCPQLSFHDFFSYEPTLGQLCAELDHIVTRAGFHCDIGSFSLYKPDDNIES